MSDAEARPPGAGGSRHPARDRCPGRPYGGRRWLDDESARRSHRRRPAAPAAPQAAGEAQVAEQPPARGSAPPPSISHATAPAVNDHRRPRICPTRPRLLRDPPPHLCRWTGHRPAGSVRPRARSPRRCPFDGLAEPDIPTFSPRRALPLHASILWRHRLPIAIAGRRRCRTPGCPVQPPPGRPCDSRPGSASVASTPPSTASPASNRCCWRGATVARTAPAGPTGTKDIADAMFVIVAHLLGGDSGRAPAW